MHCASVYDLPEGRTATSPLTLITVVPATRPRSDNRLKARVDVGFNDLSTTLKAGTRALCCTFAFKFVATLTRKEANPIL